MTNSEDSDEMPYEAAFRQRLRCGQSSGTEIHHFVEILTHSLFKYTMN